MVTSRSESTVRLLTFLSGSRERGKDGAVGQWRGRGEKGRKGGGGEVGGVKGESITKGRRVRERWQVQMTDP